MKRFLAIAAFLAIIAAPGSGVWGQELHCTVTLNYNQLDSRQMPDAQIMSQLRDYITNFLNTTRFSNDRFMQEERIKCKLNIDLVRSPNQGNYEGRAQLSILRPVYNSSYESLLFSYIDRNFNFTFLPNNPMFFNENSYTEELPYILAYYAYIALAMDYDSFSKQGGGPYIQKAFNLANLARNSSAYQKSWSSGGDTRSRYWLVENLMNQQFVPFREAMYSYHRIAMDQIVEKPAESRKTVLEVLRIIRELVQLRPATVVINSFFDSKSDELFNVLREGDPSQRQQAFDLLSALDPGKTEHYRKLTQPGL